MPKRNNILRGKQHPRAVLSNKLVRQLRDEHYDRKLCVKCLAIIYKLNYQTTYDAIKYKTWKHLL